MKLWIFGDSFSKKFETKYGWDRNYIQIKGYHPKVFGELLSESLGFELKNFSAYGNSNYDIFHSFVDVIDRIEPNDIIIIQWVSMRIIRLVDKDNEFRTIDLNWNREYPFFNESQESIDAILNNRKSELFKQEIDDWIKIIKISKSNNKIIFWSPIEESTGNSNMLPFYSFNTINDETNGELKDLHLSETGHQEFAKLLLDKIKNNEKSNLI